MKSVILLALTGSILIAIQSAAIAPAISTVAARSQVVLRPIYVEHGLSTILSNGCSISVFDAGGSDKGFVKLRKEYLNNSSASQQEARIDVLLVSHIHKDHIGYLPRIGKDQIKIDTFIANLHAKQKASRLGILNLSGEPRMIFKGISTLVYSPVTLPMNDPFNVL